MSDFPPLIVGAWQLSAGHRESLPARDRIFSAWQAAVDAGIDTFDCADIYTGVETLLGEFRAWLRERRGNEAAARVRIHTKYVPDRDALATLERRNVEDTIDRSLRRLGVERLDLVQFAWWDYDVPGMIEAAGWLDDLRRAGKVHRIGATNFDGPRLEALLGAGIRIVAHQVQYSALDHRPEGEDGMVALCRQENVALLCYGTLAGGFLTDTFLAKPDPEVLSTRSLVKYRLIIDEYGGWEIYQDLLGLLAEIAGRRDTSVAAVALRYALGRPAVASAIVGLTRADRIPGLKEALSLELSDEDVAAIRELARKAPGPSGPVFGLERAKGGAHATIMRYNLGRAEGG